MMKTRAVISAMLIKPAINMASCYRSDIAAGLRR